MGTLPLHLDSYVLQDWNAPDLITELLADYPQVRFEQNR